MSVTQNITETSLEDLTEEANNNGKESAEDLIDEMVDEGTELLQSASIDTEKPLNTNYNSTNSLQDAIVNSWAGAMSSKKSKLSIKGVELSKGINEFSNSMGKVVNQLEPENKEDNKRNNSDKNSRDILEENAFNITVHELFHYNQDQEFIGKVASDKHSAEEFYTHFKEDIFGGLYEEKIPVRRTPSSFLNRAIEDEFDYSMGVMVSHLSKDKRRLLAEDLSEDYESWRKCYRENGEKLEKIEKPGWLDTGGDSKIGVLNSNLRKYESIVSNLHSSQDEEEFEEYLDELEEIISEDSENYESESHHSKSPENLYQNIEEVRNSKKEIIENNKKKKEHEKSVNQYIMNLLDKSGLGEPVSKPFKEAFAHMTTLALQSDLNDEEARNNYLDRVEEGYNDDSAWGYDEDAGTMLRDITETVIEENGEIEGSTENQIERIHQLQSEYADQHRIAYEH